MAVFLETGGVMGVEVYDSWTSRKTWIRPAPRNGGWEIRGDGKGNVSLGGIESGIYVIGEVEFRQDYEQGLGHKVSNKEWSELLESLKKR